MTAQENSPAGPGHSGLRAAEMVQSGHGQTSAIERAPGIWESRGIGNSYLVTTDDGDVLINAGGLGDARRGRDLFTKVSNRAIRYIILTQSHANQFGGLEVYKTDRNVVLAHRNYPDERAINEMLAAHYRRGSRRIFAGITGRTQDILPTKEVTPDLLIGDGGYQFSLGNRQFEVIWTPGGETRSAVIVWLPQERIAIVGNLFGPLFGNHPNLNTMRGDKPRSAREFIASAKKVRDLRPKLLLTGHEAIEGEGRIAADLTRIIDAVQWVHDRTIEGMNEGKDLRSLMRDIRTPAELELTEEYGKVAWNVRAIWHEYTGWFDPDRGTIELYGAAPNGAARELADIAGGAEVIARRAADILADRPLDALQVVQVAIDADTNCQFAHVVQAEAHARILERYGDKNLWERMWIGAQIRKNEGQAASTMN
jgi:alkyl sulfatase BDS1-like metallo-beta-lactamase superfamily hydrolase